MFQKEGEVSSVECYQEVKKRPEKMSRHFKQSGDALVSGDLGRDKFSTEICSTDC